MINLIRGSLSILLILHVAIGLIFTGLLSWLQNLQLGASFAVGSALMLSNLIFLAWSTYRTIAKKSIAWTTVIIVIKYAVLLGSLIICVRSPWFDLFGAGLGFASFLISVLLTVLYLNMKEKLKIGTGTF